MRHKILLLLFTVLFFTGHNFAAPAEAEYKKIQESWTLSRDGSQIYHLYQELTLFTHTAMNSTYGETFITYNPKYQELKIHASYTKQKDGTIIHTPQNAFVEVLPQNASGAPAYSHLKEMVIVHTGLELGATIVLDYSIISHADYYPEIDVCQPLLKSSPIKEYMLTVTTPSGKVCNHETIGIKKLPAISTQGDYKILKWEFHNLPASPRTPETFLQNGDIPGILVTTYPTVRHALQTLYKQFDTAGSVTTLAKQLIKDQTDNLHKLQEIHNFVVTHIDDSPLTLTETAYRLRSASEVINTAYGTEAEKVNLLTALLNASGIPAIPAATYCLNVSPEKCGLSAIEQLFVLTKVAGKQFYLNVYSMSPAAQNGSFILDLKDATKQLPDQSTAKIEYQARINWINGMAISLIEATLSNRYLSYSPDAAQALLSMEEEKKIIQGTDNITITGSCTPKITPNQNYSLLTLPETNRSLSNTSNYQQYNSKRANNLLLPYTIDEKYTYTISLPDSLMLCSPIREIKIENKIGSLLYSIKSKNSQVHVSRSLQINQKLISPSDYPAFRQLITEWIDFNNRQLLLKRKD